MTNGSIERLGGAALLILALVVALGPSARAETFEPNDLPCPASSPTSMSETNLEINETRQFGSSGIMVRVTRVTTGEPTNSYQDGTTGFSADLRLPTTTIRQLDFYGKDPERYDGPIRRFSICGAVYEVKSEFGHISLHNTITIQVIPAGF